MVLRVSWRQAGIFLGVLSLVLIARVVYLAPWQVQPAMAEPQGVRVPVVMYHHISTDPARWGEWTLSPEALEADFRYLTENGYTAISVQTLYAILDGEQEAPEKPILLTFDDGHESVYAYAYPLLEQYDLCAVVNVVGEYADAYTEQEDHTIAYSYLTWPQIGELAASGRVEIGNHSQALHDNRTRKGCRILPGEDPDAYAQMLREDTAACGEQIRERTGTAACVYAYPFGYRCQEARDVLVEMGYTVLFGCGEETATVYPGQQVLEMGRYNRAYGEESAAFFARIAR